MSPLLVGQRGAESCPASSPSPAALWGPPLPKASPFGPFPELHRAPAEKGRGLKMCPAPRSLPLPSAHKEGAQGGCCLSRQEAASPRSPPARLRVGEAKQTPRDLPAGSQSHLLTGSWWERGRCTAWEGNVALGGSEGSFMVTATGGAGIGSAAHEGFGVSAPQKGRGTPSGSTQHEENHPKSS